MEILSRRAHNTSLSTNSNDHSGKSNKSAAKEFEALLIGHLLQSAFSSDEGILSGSGDCGQQTMLDFGREHLARVMALGGGLGLASIVEAGLARDKPGH